MQNKINVINTQHNVNSMSEFVKSIGNSIENNIIYELDGSKWQSNAKNKLELYLEQVVSQMNDFRNSLKKIENSFPNFEKINDLNSQIENLEKENINLELSLNPENSIKIQENKEKIENIKNDIDQIKKNVRMEWV